MRRRLGQQGFSLVELITVIGIMTILMSISTLYFNRMQMKSNIEKEVNTIYTTLTAVRLEALYGKTPRVVTLSDRQFNIYSSGVITTTPVSSMTLAYPVLLTGGVSRVDFESTGMSASTTPQAICVALGGTLADNIGNVDSVVVAAAKTYLGKRNSGGACAPDNIVQK